jgi:hypothetical protein
MLVRARVRIICRHDLLDTHFDIATGYPEISRRNRADMSKSMSALHLRWF